MMKITGLSHLFKWENLHNWWLTKYFFAPLYVSAQGRGSLGGRVMFFKEGISFHECVLVCAHCY